MKRAAIFFSLLILSNGFKIDAHSSTDFSLRIIYKANQDAKKEIYSLRCEPNSIRVSKKCARLLKVSSPFDSIELDKICSQIFGGTEIARIKGYWRGNKVDSIFSKSNGCEIDRWNKIRFLFPHNTN